MKAEIISIGTEILLGEITDTNAPYLASELPLLGIDLYWITQVGDNRNRLLDALRRAYGRSDLTILTGGLGPTEDDVTREAIAELVGEEMAVDPEIESWLRSLFEKMAIEMPRSNLRQANLIPSARPVPNRRGTAPGWWVEHQGRIIVAIPGPPGEMKQMWETEVRPALRQHLSDEVILSRVIKIFGLTEATVDEMVSPLLSSTNPTLAVYAKPDGIHLRLTAKSADPEDARRKIAEAEGKLRRTLEPAVWGTDDDTLEALIGDLLKKWTLSLATMESCTGGLLANLITDVAGSSDYFRGGLVAYTAEAKATFGVDRRLLDKHGTVHPNIARAMAEASRHRLGADIGIGVTGVAGPSELEGKPVGTIHIAVTSEERDEAFSYVFPARRLEVKRRAAYAALFRLRQLLLNEA